MMANAVRLLGTAETGGLQGMCVCVHVCMHPCIVSICVCVLESWSEKGEQFQRVQPSRESIGSACFLRVAQLGSNI